MSELDKTLASGRMLSREERKLRLAYKNMMSRCYNEKNASYRHYGGRGIEVCEEWCNSRDAFITWAVANGHAENLSLDRINNDAGYYPSNCRWTTLTQQLNNQRRNHIISFNGVALTLSEWAQKIGIRADTLLRRLTVYRMPLDKALRSESLREWKHGTRAGYEGHGCRCDLCRASNALRGRKLRASRAAKKKERLLGEVL